MKKNSTSQSAPARCSLGEGGFLNLRVLIGLCVVLAGVFLALLGFGTFSAQAQQYKIATQSIDPLVPAGFDCSRIEELGIDKQENMRAQAIMIFCGRAEGGSASPSRTFSQVVQQLLPAPLAFGAGDVNLITGTESSPNITQSETFTTVNPENPNQIVVAYNDSRGRNANPINISGASVSTDGGTSFTRLTLASGQGPFSNTVGDPVILFNGPTDTWYTVWLDGACGGQGLGGYKSTTPWVATSWTHFNCIHSNNNDDRESGWADNNPSSPFYGRMYVSWNDFNRGGGLFVRYSTDNGATWTNERQLTTGTPFIRDVQITGDKVNGDVYIAGMDEGGGGFPHNDINKIYRSTDGGNTWTNTYSGPSFPGPGVGAVGYFACMFPVGTTFYWRHEGWGEPAAYNQVVHLVYAQHGAGADAGDVYYIRSTNRGVTFSAPFKLNTDATTRPQWQPNISVSDAGTVFATWYDARESTSCTSGNPGVPCYRMWSRKSNDNGVSWQPDMQFSDVVSPLPAQPDPGIQATYAGDYDYGSAVLVKHATSWVDGRVAIAGGSQQDAFTDRELVSQSPTPTPTATPMSTATPTPTVTPTATPTSTPTQCVVPNFIGTQIRRATQTWVAAGFNGNNITTIGNPGQKITSQSLPAGSVGNCGTTTITVSH
jgi:hypothetical protein